MFKVQVPIAAAGGMGRDKCGGRGGFRGKSESRKKNVLVPFFGGKKVF